VKPPRRGQIIKINFSPQQGHEQLGYRPALVVSNSQYNKSTGLMLACPITSTVRGHGLEVLLEGTQTIGVVLINQVKALDWKTRGFNPVEQAPSAILQTVFEKLIALLDE
jgi:mRNA interferase MazF